MKKSSHWLGSAKAFLLLAFILTLSACGGGGGSSATSADGAAPSVVFPVDTVIRNFVVNGYAATFTLSGKVQGIAVGGSGTALQKSAAQTTFEGRAAFDAVVSNSITINVQGSTQTDTSVTHQYFSTAYEPLGEVDEGSGAYRVTTSFAGWPKNARVGDSGSLASATVYSSSAKTSVLGKQNVSYTVEADGPTTAVLVLLTTDTDNNGKEVLKQTNRYRIGTDGTVALLSTRGVITDSGLTADLTMNVASLGAPPPAQTPATTPSPTPVPTTPVAPPAVPPPTVTPVPSELWTPPAGATPASGNYVYLQSDAGDYIGAGQTLLYTQANAVMAVSATAGKLAVYINGNQSWNGDFQEPGSLQQLTAGYYAGLTRYPFHNATVGGLNWGGEGRGCNTLTGWFAVDHAEYSNGSLATIDLRFEQHCEGGGPALHGKLHWTKDDATAPAGPVNPVPATLWQPPAAGVPASGNYVYLQSETGDYIGQGITATYTAANSTMSVSSSSGRAQINVGNNQTIWSGTFQAMSGLPQLLPGYYGGLMRYPFHNPTKGGMDWSGNGRGCNTLTGWFVIDNATYKLGTLTSLDLRFEQHCEGLAPAMYGKVHWAG